MTSVHRRDDTRIFEKMCISAASSGYNVELVTMDGGEIETARGVKINAIAGRPKNRFVRFVFSNWKVFCNLYRTDPGLIQFHDPELLPAAILLKYFKKRTLVIFDSHEDYKKQIIGKKYLWKPFRPFIATIVDLVERFAAKQLDAIVAATDEISAKYKSYKGVVLLARNYPLKAETKFFFEERNWEKNCSVAYLGSISVERGIITLLDAFDFIPEPVSISLIGEVNDISLRQEIEEHRNFPRIKFFKRLKRFEIKETLSTSFAGIVTFKPLPNHVGSAPNKIFEYMLAGLPIIASNFTKWEEFITNPDCGVLVDPQSPEDIAGAINSLFENKEHAKSLGDNGHEKVLDNYLWENEWYNLKTELERLADNRG